MTMNCTRRCFFKKLNRRHLKRILLLGCGLAIVLIIINMADKKVKVPIGQEELEMNITEEDAHWMDLMAQRMESRRKWLQKGCENLRLNIRGNDSLHRPNEWEFLVNRPFHLIWCNVFKAASTSWMYNFNILAGYSPEFLKKSHQVPLELARKKYGRPTLEGLEAALNDSTSFLIVRHPFERLLSAYRDKIEHALPNTVHHKLGNFIVRNYRRPLRKGYLLDTLKKKLTRPTFYEFVSFVLEMYRAGTPMDMHWVPITTFCTPCQVRFDIIMKFETLEDDQKYLILKQNLQQWIKPQWKNRAKGREKQLKLIKKCFSQLTATQIYDLYNLYRYDFQLFDYKIDEYLKYLKLN